MGTFLDDLDDHEGYADRRLPDGRLAGGVWIYATREFTAYVAVCGCGWQATGEHPPTKEGEEAAVDQWRSLPDHPEVAASQAEVLEEWAQRWRQRGPHDIPGRVELGLVEDIAAELRRLATTPTRQADPQREAGRER
jgi:biotin-(acetyl-CoA carboxylase) ligase